MRVGSIREEGRKASIGFVGYGYGSVFAYIAGCWLLVVLAIRLFGPRTSLRSLEQISLSKVRSRV
jgi:hypothetical protein